MSSRRIFYALALYTHLAGAGDEVNAALAWAYVGARVVHSLAQIVVRRVMLRFTVFAIGSLLLIGIAVRDLLML